MLMLAIDTSTPAVTAGVVELPDDPQGQPRLLKQAVTVDARAHGELLTPHVREALTALPGKIDAIVCGAGPGPFTGLRVGMVTAAALADALGVPVYGVCSLDAIAHDAAATADPRDGLLVATDARRRELYWAAYHDGCRTSGPHVRAPADLAQELPELDVKAAAGAGALLYADVLGLPLVEPPYPSPVGLVAVAAEIIQTRTHPEPLRPLYLRRPDAVEPATRKLVSGGGRR
jgi:tRNA threonylcarbamoyl adenosine modification protein YeaZ